MLPVLGLLLSVVTAQASEKSPIRLIHFTVFSPTPIADLGYRPVEKMPPVKVAFYPTARSTRYEYRGGSTLRFESATGSLLLREAAAEVSLPNTSDEFLLLFLPAERNSSDRPRYRIFAVDDGAGRIKSGAVTVLNLSGLILRGNVGAQTVELVAGFSPPLPLQKETRLEFRTKFRQRLYPALMESIQLNRGERALLLLFPPFRAGSLEVQSRLLVDQSPVIPADYHKN